MTAPALEPLTLSVAAIKYKGRHQVELTWAGASGAGVELWRDGALLAITANDGYEIDAPSGRGKAVYTYEICEVDGRCSPPATVSF